MGNYENHQDIRLGTLAPMSKGASYLKQILPHGFESFQLTCWQYIGDVDVEQTAKEVLDCIAGKATISAVGVFGNPLQDEQTRKDWEILIDKAHLFGCDIVAGFAGALEDRPIDESMPRYKEVWSELAKRAEDKGIRIAWENCEMGGNWGRPQYNMAHSPRAWEMMFDAVPSPALGLEWEPCHQMYSLIDPLPQLRQWLPKIFHLHGKDATIAWDVLRSKGLRGGESYVWHRTPGFGDTDWKDVISILRQANWQGAIDIEGWHDPVYKGELEMTGQVFGLNYLKQCRGGTFIPNPV
ncbi:MAG TPA: sugar phosphate isomerase/epimerase family protein [Abditibacteriaceae bacterium]|jgi:sugar phosphate isomerase/epimerase